MTDFTKILDKARELEAKMKESQEKIKSIRVEGISGSNSIKVTLDGEGEMQKIEISFNDNLDKDFVKDLSAKLFEWTGERWIITFSKSKGEMSVKEKQKNKKEE